MRPVGCSVRTKKGEDRRQSEKCQKEATKTGGPEDREVERGTLCMSTLIKKGMTSTNNETDMRPLGLLPAAPRILQRYVLPRHIDTDCISTVTHLVLLGGRLSQCGSRT